jgi:hypothetical protein
MKTIRTEMAKPRRFRNEATGGFIQKPFRIDKLSQKVREIPERNYFD